LNYARLQPPSILTPTLALSIPSPLCCGVDEGVAVDRRAGD